MLITLTFLCHSPLNCFTTIAQALGVPIMVSVESYNPINSVPPTGLKPVTYSALISIPNALSTELWRKNFSERFRNAYIFSEWDFNHCCLVPAATFKRFIFAGSLSPHRSHGMFYAIMHIPCLCVLLAQLTNTLHLWLLYISP